MILNVVAIIIMLGLAYIWLTRGFFSSLLHLTCTIIAGAIAFAAWEPISYMLLEKSPTSGLMDFLPGVAWGVGLIVPFAVSLAILRIVVDKLLPANVVLDQKLDYVGGGVCGLMTGVITAGIFVIALSFFRLPTNALGQQIGYGNAGNIVKTGGRWIPVDEWTATLYGSLSERAFRTGEPLARWHPDLPDEGAALRVTCLDQRGKTTIKPDDFEVRGHFTVGDASSKFNDLLVDRWAVNPTKPQNVTDSDKQPFPAGTHIEGFVVNFKPGARERDGKVAVGAAQVNLVIEDQNDDRKVVYPFAVSSQAEADKPTPARWRFDADNVFIASTGGGSDALFAFEFPCPPGYKPIALYVKGVRHDVQDMAAAQKFPSASARDGFISGGFGYIAASGKGGVTNTASGSIDDSGAVKITRTQLPGTTGNQMAPPEGMRITEYLPFVIQKGVHGNLELDEENNKNIILRGDATLGLDILQNKGLEKSIQIQRLQTQADTVIVQVDVSQTSRMSIVGKGPDSGANNPPPALFDTNGTKYEPIGFIYIDETKVEVSFKPGQPITSMADLPTLSRSRPAQKLTLIFRPSRNVSLKYFALGNKALCTFDPPVLLDQMQGRF